MADFLELEREAFGGQCLQSEWEVLGRTKCNWRDIVADPAGEPSCCLFVTPVMCPAASRTGCVRLSPSHVVHVSLLCTPTHNPFSSPLSCCLVPVVSRCLHLMWFMRHTVSFSIHFMLSPSHVCFCRGLGRAAKAYAVQVHELWAGSGRES